MVSPWFWETLREKILFYTSDSIHGILKHCELQKFNYYELQRFNYELQRLDFGLDFGLHN